MSAGMVVLDGVGHEVEQHLAQALTISQHMYASSSSFLTQGDTLIGTCGFDLSAGPEPEIGYWIGVPHWDKGYASEAVRGLIGRAFGELRYSALIAGARVTNATSRRVLEKCGFQWTGVALFRSRALNTSVPCDRFRLERAIWALRKSRGGIAAAAGRAAR